MGSNKKPTGTKEWAKHSHNICVGCDNNCRYCYAKDMALRFKRIRSEEEWKKEKLIHTRTMKSWRKKEGTIMFPTTHDITENNLQGCIIALNNMLKPGNKVLIVSKPRLSVIGKLLPELNKYASQILFRFTIGNLSDSVTQYWEKDASMPGGRYECLKMAYRAGFKTSVSCEPMLCGFDELVAMINGFAPYITDAMWIGKMNDIKRRVKIKTQEDERHVRQLLSYYSYENIMRIYYKFKDYPQVKWKDSIKKVVGIEAPKEIGLDI